MTMNEWRVKYEWWMRGQYRPLTFRRYCAALERFFEMYPEKTVPSDFYHADARDYVEARLAQGCGARTVEFDIAALRAFWNWMIQREIDDIERGTLPDTRRTVTYNPFSTDRKAGKKFSLPPKPEHRRRALSEQGLLDIFRACRDSRELLLCLLASTTGLRARSLVELEWRDIDFEQGILTVPPEKIKRARGLDFRLREDVLILLRELQPQSQGSRVFWWTSTPRGLQCRFKAIVRRAGRDAEGVGLHTMRRTVATLLHRQGMALRTLQEFLGHRSLKTTAQYLSPADQTEVFQMIQMLPGVAPASPAPEAFSVPSTELPHARLKEAAPK